MVVVRDRLGLVALVTIKELYDLLNNIGGHDDVIVVVNMPGAYFAVTDVDLNTTDDPPSLTINVASEPLPW